MGIAFVAWGPVVAVLTACSLGIFCALMCAIVLHHASRSRWMAILPVAMLVPAWGIALGAGDFAGAAAFVRTGTAAVASWNVLMAAAIAVWVAALRRNLPFDGQCLACRYDRRGLPDEAACPECGSALPPARPGSWEAPAAPPSGLWAPVTRRYS
jgi:hypothetical protein